MTERTVNISVAAKNFASVVKRAYRRNEATLLLKNGQPVARIVPLSTPKTGRELAETWSRLHHLLPKEAADFEVDIAASKTKIPPLASAWE